MPSLYISKDIEKTHSRKNYPQPQFEHYLPVSINILLFVPLTISILFLAFTIDNIYAEKDKDKEEDDASNNKYTKVSEFSNSKAGYKISYPSDAKLVEGQEGDDDIEKYEHVEFVDKNGEWKFSVNFYDLSPGQSIKEEVKDWKKWLQSMGKQVFDEKPLTVAGKPGLMFSHFHERFKITQIYMHANNVGYDFSISVPKNNGDQYANLLFTMLKSFKIIDKK